MKIPLIQDNVRPLGRTEMKKRTTSLQTQTGGQGQASGLTQLP